MALSRQPRLHRAPSPHRNTTAPWRLLDAFDYRRIALVFLFFSPFSTLLFLPFTPFVTYIPQIHTFLLSITLRGATRYLFAQSTL